jgi:asparagine synthase (glutamine-hydrolysing)
VKGFLLDSHFVKEGMFNQEQVLKLIEEHHSSKVDHHVRLWMLLNLEIWRQIYIEEESFLKVEQKVQRYLRSEKYRPVGVIDEPGYSTG